MVHDHHLAHLLVLVVEGELLEQNVVKQHSQRPNIHWLSTVFCLGDNLGSHVRGSSAKNAQFDRIFDNYGKPKVYQFNIVLRIQQQIFQFYISMHNIKLVTIIYALNNLSEHSLPFMLAQSMRLYAFQMSP